MKRILILIAIFTTISISQIVTYADFKDVNKEDVLYGPISRINHLGIMNGVGYGVFLPNENLTREQFVKVIISSMGMDDAAKTLTNSTIFPDIDPYGWSTKYIKLAVNKGYLKGMADGKFYPKNNITFAQVCTVMVKVLGYQDNDLIGSWPENYITTAKTLKIPFEINKNANDLVTRGEIAKMLDNLLNTDMKKTASQESSIPFSDYYTLYKEVIILGTSETSGKILSNQVLTDKGIYYKYNQEQQFDVGNKYRVKIQDDTIYTVYDKINTLTKVTVKDIGNMRISYLDEKKSLKNLTLPEMTDYYYNGIKQSYSNLSTIIKKNFKIIFSSSYKKNNAFELAVILDSYNTSLGEEVEFIVFGNNKTSDKLTKNQVLTNKGIFYIDANTPNLELGNMYRVIVDDEKIVQVEEKETTSSKTLCVANSIDTKVTYKDANNVESIVLPEKTVYYNNESLVSYNNLKTILVPNATIIFAKDDTVPDYQYALILDPVYSKPEVFNQSQIVDNTVTKIGNLDLMGISTIVKDDKIINLSGIYPMNVLYKVTDVFGNNAYLKVIENVVEGKLTSIIPDRISPTSIKIDDTTYQLSKDMNFSKINSSSSAFTTNSKVSVLLGFDGKVVDVFNRGYKTGPKVEYKILGTSASMPTLAENQVYTDKGTLYTPDSSFKPELGYVYKMIVDGDTIVKVVEKTRTAFNVSVNNIIGTKITYKDQAGMLTSMTLPEKIPYYYKGVLQTFDAAKTLLGLNSSIVFVNNENNTGFEYAVIADAVYSKPEIAISFIPTINRHLGNIEIPDGMTILKNGSVITVYDIDQYQVVYKISDVWGQNPYILVVDNKIIGTITSILPNKISPTSVKMSNGITYEIGEYLNLSKLNTTTTAAFKVGDTVKLLLGQDGKIVDIIVY